MEQRQPKHLSPWIAWSLVILFAGIAAFATWMYYSQLSNVYDNQTFFGVKVHKTATATTPTTSTTTTTPTVKPETVAKNFYTYYLGLVNPNGQDDSQAKFQSTSTPYHLKTGFNTYLTATLITNLESLFNGNYNSDPILCAQEIPSSVTYDIATITSSTATSVANMQFTPVRHVTLGYVIENGAWKINSITCPTQ